MFGLTIQKAYLNKTHRTLIYDKIYSLSEVRYNEIKILCHSCLISFATLYPDEILNLIKEKFQLTGNLINLIIEVWFRILFYFKIKFYHFNCFRWRESRNTNS